MSNPTLTPTNVKEMLLKVADVIIESEEELSQADRDLGDGDHGLGMQRGFTAAKAQLEPLEPKTVSEVFTTTGMALMANTAARAVMGCSSKVGELPSQRSLDTDGLLTERSMRWGYQVGGAKPGDKTMVDALVVLAIRPKGAIASPSVKPVKQRLAEPKAWRLPAMIATMGRAKPWEKSYRLSRSRSASVSVIF